MEIFQYFRDKQNRKIGVVLVDINFSERKLGFGWSLCAENRGDRFDRNFGVTVARERAKKRGEAGFRGLPEKMEGLAETMKLRARRILQNDRIKLTLGARKEPEFFVQKCGRMMEYIQKPD